MGTANARNTRSDDLLAPCRPTIITTGTVVDTSATRALIGFGASQSALRQGSRAKRPEHDYSQVKRALATVGSESKRKLPRAYQSDSNAMATKNGSRIQMPTVMDT